MNDTDLDGLPIVSKGSAQRNFVAPAPLATRPTPATIDAPAWLGHSEPMGLAGAWESQQGARETSTPIDRAKALQLRLWPFVGLWGGVGVVLGATVFIVAGSAPGGALLAVLTFASLTGFTYYRLNGQDYAYSREGTEQHRVNVAADLARRQMAHEHELRRLALESYLQALERHEGKR